MRNLINFPFYSLILLLFPILVSTNLYSQNNNGNNGNGNGGGNSEPIILDVTATSKSVCPTSTINISFILKNGRGNASSGAYFTTATEFTISLIYLDDVGNPEIVNSRTPFSLTNSEIPDPTNDATSLPITRTYTIPIGTDTRPEYRIEISSTEPVIAGSISSRSDTFTISDNNYWTGAIDSDWNKAGNWDCDLIPSFINNAVINNVLTRYPLLNTGAAGECKDLIIESGSLLRVLDNTLSISGTIASSGTFNSLHGSIAFMGSIAQTIPSNVFLNNRIRNLIIENTAGVSSLGELEVTGFLKVQTGDFYTNNAFTLISTPTQTALIDGSGTGQVLGNVTMQRYLDNAFGYKYFSSPFKNSKVGDFTDIDLNEAFPNFYRYDENRKININDTLRDATGWEAYTTADDALNVMEGYALNFGESSAALTVSLTGEVNNEDYSRVLENNQGEYTKGFHLVGNPYPSPIDWEAGGWTKTNIDDQIHFFTAGTEYRYTGTYESFVNGVAQNGGSASSIIPSMQGFFVKVSNSAATGNLGITNSVRVENFTQEFYRNQAPAPKPLIRLNAGFKGEGNKDGMVIYFENLATSDFDSQLDAHKLMNTDVNVPNLYSLTSNGEELSINAMNQPETGVGIPLGFKTERSGTLSISLQDLENLPFDFAVFLKDKEKNRITDLRKQAYSFEGKKGTTNSRFELVFSEEPFQKIEDLEGEFFSVRSDDGIMKVDLKLEEKEEGILRLSTVTGQLLESKAGRGKEQVNFNGISSSGIYFVILEKDGKRYTKKVLIRK